MKIGIIGSGNVGITTAFAIAEKSSGHVMLWDVVAGRARGKALDLAEAAPIRRYDARIDGSDDFEDLMDANVLVIAAGKPRTEGLKRFDMFDENLPVIRELAGKIKAGYKKSEPPLVIILPEPVDLNTLAFQRATGWPRERIIGVAGNLSASRLRHFVGRELEIAPSDIDAMVVGTHGDEMAILERYCRVSGLPLETFLDRGQIDEIFEKTRKAGTEIVEQAKLGSSFYTPGAAVAELVQAIALDSNRVLLASTVLEGEWGVKGRAVSVPVKVGCSGVKKIYELELTDDEEALFRRSVATQDPYIARIEG
jgi:malate dehydrogenase